MGMSRLDRVVALRGRARECEALDRLLDGVRSRRSQVLVVRGEPGIGKTALLEYLAGAASRCRVAHASGIESEMELAYAGLHQLCAPMLDRAGRLAAPQRDALETAFGLSEGRQPDRFLLSLAVLSLLSAVAEKQPLICLVDDAQWLDGASRQALVFVARRLFAESVALLFSVREPDDSQEFSGLPALPLGPLSEEDARSLLEAAIPGRLDERVEDRIVAETRGNPLALLELSRGLAGSDLAGGYAAPDAGQGPSLIEHRFHQQIQSLPADSQRLLLAAAAEPLGDIGLLWRAAELLGIGTDAAAPAETAGLVEFRGRVRFLHPLVRSAAYRARPLPERREIHRALAAVTDPNTDPDRHAWHRALAAVGLDEAVAGELEAAAHRAQARGGIGAAAAFLERASRLTPDAAQRSARSLAAAEAKFEAGAPEAAYELTAAAEVGPVDEQQRAQLARLRARIVFARNRSSQASELLLDAARRLESLDPAMARETYLEAIGTAVFAGRLVDRVGVHEAAAAALGAPPAPEPPRAIDLLLDGVTTRITAGYLAGVVPLQRALLAFRKEADRGDPGASVRWLFTACPVAPEPIAAELWDDETWHYLSASAVRLSRDAGALAILPLALCYRAGVLLHAGDFAGSAADVEEANAITAATGSAPFPYTTLMLASWQGREMPALRLLEQGDRDASARGDGRAIGLIGYARAVLHNGLGQYRAALAGAQQACRHEDLGFYGWALAELIEAAARSGAQDMAAAALRELETRTRAAGSDWALGMLARSSALVTDGDAADVLYREAIERLSRSRMAVHLARAHLLYGEWLRRENRRVDARAQLKTAHEMLSGFGAEAFAERARHELAATGETVTKRSVERHDGLTAQEAQVAWLAADGRTNPEIATQLFISPRTAEYHLHKVFGKLGISSRRDLRRAMARELAPTA